MDDRCHFIEDLPQIMNLPEGDTGRQHLDQCPRCQTLARQFDAFMHPGPLPTAADLAGAGSELNRRLEDELNLSMSPVTTRPSKNHSFWRLAPGQGRPLLAMAAVLVICVGLLTIRHQMVEESPRGDSEVTILRGQASLTLAQVEGNNLVWTLPEQSDEATVVLYNASLQEIAKIAAPMTTTLDLTTISHPETRYVRVLFLSGGDIVKQSSIITLARPES